MDGDDVPVSGHLKASLCWAMGLFLLLVAGMLALAVYALLTRRFGPELAIELGLPPLIGVAAVMYLIAGFHRRLQAVSQSRFAVLAVALSTLAATLTWGVVSLVQAHPSRQLELALRLILLVVFICLFRVMVKERKK
jgi:hypothetical protein